MDSHTKGEMAEAGIDSFIAKRDKQRRRDDGERAAEELYMQSTRRYAERERLRLRWEWLRYHEEQIRRLTANLEALITRHRTEARRLAELLGVEPIDQISKRNGYRRGAA
jgi:hypothetical protein